jgi:apolipoprotein N-acyltransferase
MRSIPARLWGLAVLSGALQVLPFPIGGPVPLWRTAFAWVALIPLLLCLTSNGRDGKPLSLYSSALLGYASGIIWYLGSCYWIYQTMNIYGGLAAPVAAGILVLFCLYLGLYHALFGAIIGVLCRVRNGRRLTLALAPFAWVAVELARARITGFPWDLLGITEVDNPVMTALAPVTGAYGLSFVVALVNSLWLLRIRVRNRRFLRPALTLVGISILAAYAFALHKLANSPPDSSTAAATLVQENLKVGATNKGPVESTQQMLDSFSYLSTHPSPTFLAGIPELAGTPEVFLLHKGDAGAAISPEDSTWSDRMRNWTPHSDLIVWPESPSGFRTDDPAFLTRMHLLSNSAETPLIIGSLGLVVNADPGAQRPYFLYDSAATFVPQQAGNGRYDKIHLVPWGEYIPFKDFFFFARKLTAGAGDMDRGSRRTLLTTNGHIYGTFICYESIFGDEVRQFVKDGAEVLVNISDDGWYGDTSAAWQHLNMVRMRAIENHRWVLRSTNTGVTAAINPHGQVTVAAPRHIRTSLRAPFGYESDLTFYTRHGDLFAYACALITLAALVFALRRWQH